MLIEAMLIAATASCGPNVTTADSYTICAEKKQQEATSTARKSGVYTPEPKPMRLCRYYVNNTIDIPTAGIISAWVPVGSRSCIGDAPPEPKVAAAPKTAVQTISTAETLTAYANRPFAYWSPGGELEIFQAGSFGVAVNNRITSGQLFGSPAQIRFTASAATWKFSDGNQLSGTAVSRSFESVGEYFASATVAYRVDYQITGDNWVIGATTISLESNKLRIEVIEPPRRTLLVE